MVQRRVLYDERVALWREPDVSRLSSRFIFSILFSLKLAGGFEWPLLLCRKEIRGYEFRSLWAASLAPLSCSWRVSPCETFASLSKGSRFSDRFGFIGYLTFDRSAPISRWGPPRTPDSIQYHPSYFVRGGRNEKFSRESRWRALDKGYCYLQQYSGIGYINLGRFSFYLENISFVQSATLISRYHNYINSVAGFGSKIGNDGKRLISEIDRVIYYFDSLIIINICTYMTRYVVFFFLFRQPIGRFLW